MARQDEDGYYYYMGRNDDVISSSGYRIGAVEVENVLIEHPGVVECAVVGKPDELKGEVVKAFDVLKKDLQPTNSLQQEIQLFVKERLSKHNYPREVEFIDELPKTPSGKIRRKVLQEKEYERMGKRLTKSVNPLL